MAQVPATLSVLRTRGGLRRLLVAYGVYDLVDMAIWVAIIFYAYDVGGVSLVGIVAVVQLCRPRSSVPPWWASGTDCHEVPPWSCRTEVSP